MNENQEKDKRVIRNRFPDRLTVEAKNLEKLGSLINQVQSYNQDIDISKKDLVNWIIEDFSHEFSQKQLKSLFEHFYSEERFLKHATEEIKSARLRGEKLTLEEVMLRRKSSLAEPRQTVPKKKSKSSESQLEESAPEGK